MPSWLPVILASSQLVLVAQEVPQLNYETSCRSSAARAISSDRTAEACLRDERQARAKLEQTWSQFSAGEQERCVRLTHLGGQPSYVELLTCLEIAKQAKELPDSKQDRIER